MSEELEAVDKAIKAFQTYSTSMGKYGATDTEPRCLFLDCLEKAYKCEPQDIPRAPSEWELYDMCGAVKVAQSLSTLAAKVVSAIGDTKMKDHKELGKLLHNVF